MRFDAIDISQHWFRALYMQVDLRFDLRVNNVLSVYQLIV